jgi:uncharacterized membrane protein YgcG
VTSTVRRLATVLLAFATLSVSWAAPAHADPPRRLADQVTDRAGALGAGRTDVDTALARLQADTGLQLFVVIVASFDGLVAKDWAAETARVSDFGDGDALLAVAVEDRSWATDFPQDVGLTDAQIAEVGRSVEPALQRGDWSNAVVVAADGYRDAQSSGSSPALVGALCLVAAVIGGALIWVVLRRRKRATTAPQPQAGPAAPAGPPDPHAGTGTADLDARANALLIELDDDLRASDRELALATAQYGPAATATFQSALDAARADVAEAFRLRMTLDELPVPDDAAHRRILAEIIARCEAADASLDAESEEFDRLRDLESRIDEVTTQLRLRSAAVEAALPAADTALHTIMQRYGGPGVTAVARNVVAARERLAFATTALNPPDDADPASADPTGPADPAGVPGGARAEAALAARAAEQAVDQAEQLIAAIHRAGADLDAAHTAVDALIAEVQSELTAGRAAVAASGAGLAELAAAVAAAEQTLEAVRAAASAPTTDPIAAVQTLTEADSALDRALADARDLTERTARSRTMLAQALPVARAEVAAAGDFITTRRGAVQGPARASLAEAQRHLALAESLADGDPVGALAEAQQAHRRAAEAGQAARDDVQQWSGPGGFGGTGLGGGFGGGGFGGGRGFDAGSFAGAVLGGILAGGGRSGGGSGGGGWGGGGFGGSGSRGRRTGGGGRRSAGGRF